MPEKDDLPTEPDADLPPRPESVGPYRILRELGEGGMGVVYLAAQTAPIRRQVALKVIKLGMDTRDVIARFEAERQVLAVLDHPHIAKVIDAGCTPDGRPFFVMEHVPGVAITTYCDAERLDLSDRLRLFVQVCRGLHHAHERGIIHRDVKPSNVLVTAVDGRPWVKIIDFGVAKATDRRLTEQTLLTEDGRIMGTPAYMSPEQTALSGGDVDGRADVYSLGMILYELLVGSLPFDQAELCSLDFAEMRRRICDGDTPTPSRRYARLGEDGAGVADHRRAKPSALLRDLRGDLDWIVMKALAKDRAERYPAAADLADDVQRHLDHQPVSVGPPGAAALASRWVRRHGARAAVVGAFGVLVAGLTVLAVLYAQQLGQASGGDTTGETTVATPAARRPDLEGSTPPVRRLPMVTGEVLDLATLAGRKVLLVVAGGVYGQARADLALEADLAACRRTLSGVEVVVVYPLPTPDPGAATVLHQNFLSELPYTVAFDTDLALARALGVEQGRHVFPTLVLIDEKGVIEMAFTGVEESTMGDALEAIIVRIVLA